MPADKPRHLQNSHDLILSIVPLVLICLALAGLARGCSFSPGGPSAAAPPTVDAARIYADDAAAESFPIRSPELPAGWLANSSSNASVGGTNGGSSVRVGYISPGGSYLKLVQSSATADQLLPAEAGGLTGRASSGSKQVGGATWNLYVQKGTETAWVSDLGAVRLLITGSGSDAEFTVLAGSVLARPPLLR